MDPDIRINNISNNRVTRISIANNITMGDRDIHKTSIIIINRILNFKTKITKINNKTERNSLKISLANKINNNLELIIKLLKANNNPNLKSKINPNSNPKINPKPNPKFQVPRLSNLISVLTG